MKIEDFGFKPVMGKDYVVSFTKDGELLSTSVYNGTSLPAVKFPDNAKIGLAITDKETGKEVMSSEFISYNGKLYKSVFDLQLKNPDSNKNANVYIKDLHYDLTSGSVLVEVQGFAKDEYKLVISDTTLKHKAFEMPITLKDNMSYSIPTELVQGNEFEVTLQDANGKPVDAQQFTAPISTDWRHTDNSEGKELTLDEDTDEHASEEVPVATQDATANAEQSTESSQSTNTLVPSGLAQYQKPLFIGGGILVFVILFILIARSINKKRAKAEWEDPEQGDYEDSEDTLDTKEDREEEYTEVYQEKEVELEDVSDDVDLDELEDVAETESQGKPKGRK